MKRTKILLDEDEIPRRWYNINADLEEMGVQLPPVKDPETGEPVSPDRLQPLFPRALIGQEMSEERFVSIPDPVRQRYSMWRPTPLYRAHRWEEKLDTPASIYYKYEGGSPSGSHKPNTAVPQAFYNRREGTERITTETGAGQWGSALSFAALQEELACRVFMVRVSYEQKPYRRVLMQTWDAEVLPSPSRETRAGREILKEDPDSSGSLGIAISEAVEQAMEDPGTKYSLGSVLNHVLLHQTVIGRETLKQLETAGDVWPDVVIACSGGGSNFGGFVFPILHRSLEEQRRTRFLAVEPKAAPSLTEGEYRYDFGDTAGTTPLFKMRTLGHDFMPAPIHSGGLRYHGMNPQISALYEAGHIEAVAAYQNPVFEAAREFTQTEGILPAPEPGHALWAAREEALACRASGEPRTILFHLCGHGHFDLSAYQAYLAGELEDFEH